MKRKRRTLSQPKLPPLPIESIEKRIYFSVSFAAPKVLPRSVTGPAAGAIVEGDFGNGHPDVAVLSEGTSGAAGSVQVFLNNGQGRFSLAQTLVTGGGSQVMQAVDLFGTGQLDLIVSNAGDGTLDIFTGSGTPSGSGTFSATPQVVPFGPQEVFSGSSVFNDPFQVAPLNGPGSPNGIVVANQYAGDVIVLQLDANQQLNLAQTVPVQLADFVLDDVTGDGLPDIVQTSATDVTVLANQAGTFAATVSADYPLNLPADYSATFEHITTGDFAGNGLTDLAITAQPDSTLLNADPNTPGELSVLMAQPGGGLAPAVLSSEPADDRGPVAADIDGDGVLDLVTQSAGSSDVLIGNGDGTFTDQNLAIPDAGIDQFAVADFNGDGNIDFITVDSQMRLALYASRTTSPTSGSSDLSPVVTRSTLPAAIIAGSNAHGTAIVAVTNTDATLQSGQVTTAVYASSDGLFDDAAVQLGSVTRTLVIKPGETMSVPVQIKSLPSSLNGTFMLLAQTTNASGTAATESGPSIVISAPFVAIGETIIQTTLPAVAVSGQSIRAMARIKLTNNGNVTSSGNATVAIYASPDGIAGDGFLIRSLTTSKALRPGASATINVPLQALPATPEADYFLVAQVTDSAGDVTSSASSGTYHLAPAFVALTPMVVADTLPATVTSGIKSAASITLSIANNGNFPSTGISTVAIYATADGIPADGTLLISKSVHSVIRPGKSMRARMVLKSLSQLPAGSYSIVAVVTDSTGAVQMVVAPATLIVT